MNYADECLQRVTASDSKKNLVKARRLRAQAFMAEGRLDDAGQELPLALKVAREIGNPPQLWKTYAAFGDLRSAQGRPDEARQAYGEAFSVIERVATSLTDQQLRDTFLRSQHVEMIRRPLGAQLE